MKVLTIELDQTTAAFMREHGIAVEAQEVEDAEDLQSWLTDGLYDACVVNLEKSGLGIYVARGLRANKITASLVGISRGSEGRVWGDQRALFLENGGDDLLRGPVNPRELVATLRATSRRLKGALIDVAEYQHGEAGLKVNLTTKSVVVNGIPIDLTGKERSLMLLFASSPGRTMSKETLIAQMYSGGVDDEPETKIIDVFVCKLRRKLADIHPDAEQFIETVWGQGYRLPEETALTKKVA